MSELFYTKLTSVLLKFPLLDSLDIAILLRILNSPKSTKRISYRELARRIDFATGKQIGLTRIQYSARKVVFMGLLIKKNITRPNGKDGTNLYKYNSNRNQWVLYKTLRKVLNQEEELRDKEASLSSNSADFKDHFAWICAFERTLPVSLRKYIGEDGDLLEDKVSELNKLSKEADLINRIETGDNLYDSPLHNLEGILKSIEKPTSKKTHLKKE